MGTAASKQQQPPARSSAPQPTATAAAPAAQAPPTQEQQQSQPQPQAGASLPWTGSGALLKLGPMPPAEAKRWCLTIGGAKPQAAYRCVVCAR